MIFLEPKYVNIYSILVEFFPYAPLTREINEYVLKQWVNHKHYYVWFNILILYHCLSQTLRD